LDGHSDFISDSDKQKASFGTVDSDLPDELIEALSIEFFSDWADTCFSCLPLLEPFVELLLEEENICLGKVNL
jgi:hypothetical protein